MKQLGLALHNYHDTHRCFPPGAFAENRSTQVSPPYPPEAGNGLSFHTMILPFIDQANLYQRINTNVGTWAAGGNTTYGSTRVAGFLCPSASEDRSQNNNAWYCAHYLGVMGPANNGSAYTSPITGHTYGFISPPGQGGENWGGYTLDGVLLRGVSTKMRDITDGTSRTFLLGESSRDADKTNNRCWLRGGQNNSSCVSTRNVVNAINAPTPNFNNKSFSSNHVGGAFFLYGDGSVSFLSENIDKNVYYGLSSRDGGETVSLGN